MARLASLFFASLMINDFLGGPSPGACLQARIDYKLACDRSRSSSVEFEAIQAIAIALKFGPSPGDHLPWSSRTLGRFDQSATLLTLQKWYHVMRIKFQMFQTADHNDGTWSGLDFNPYRLSGLKSSYLAQRCASYFNQFLSVAAPPVIINQAKLTWNRFRSPLSPTDTNILIEN